MQSGGTAWTGSKGDGGNTSGWGGKTGGGGGQSGGSPSDKGPGAGQGTGAGQGAGVGQGSTQQLPPPQGQPVFTVDIHRAILVLISDADSNGVDKNPTTGKNKLYIQLSRSNGSIFDPHRKQPESDYFFKIILFLKI